MLCMIRKVIKTEELPRRQEALLTPRYQQQKFVRVDVPLAGFLVWTDATVWGKVWPSFWCQSGRSERERKRTGVGLIELSALTLSKWSVNVSQLSDLFCMSAPLASRKFKKKGEDNLRHAVSPLRASETCFCFLSRRCVHHKSMLLVAKCNLPEQWLYFYIFPILYFFPPSPFSIFLFISVCLSFILSPYSSFVFFVFLYFLFLLYFLPPSFNVCFPNRSLSSSLFRCVFISLLFPFLFLFLRLLMLVFLISVSLLYLKLLKLLRLSFCLSFILSVIYFWYSPFFIYLFIFFAYRFLFPSPYLPVSFVPLTSLYSHAA